MLAGHSSGNHDLKWLRSELDRFNPLVASHGALTPPWTWYVDQRFLEIETDAVFKASWHPAARADQLTQPGDCVASHLFGQPFAIVRGHDGKLRAFHNVCAHHAAEVAVTGSGCQQLVCSYHGWRYDLEGQLIKAPSLGSQDNFDPCDYGLRPMAVVEWGPLVFLNLDQDATDIADQLAPLKTRLDELGFDDMRFVTRREYVLECNWKVFVDNYLDGGYHVAAVHPGLADQLDLEDYKTEIFDSFSIQSCDAAKPERAAGSVTEESSGDFADRIGGGSIYAWLFPNFMINRYGPMMDTNWVVPLSPSKTLTVFDYYFQPESIPAGYPDCPEDPSPAVAAQYDFINRSLAASHQVQVEDVSVCESVQRGLAAKVFTGGRYALMEQGEHHFHCLLHKALSKQLQQSEQA